MHIFIKTHESGFEWILRDGSVTHADLESANEAELIFWNKEDWWQAPVRGDPRWRRCYVLIISLTFYLNKMYQNSHIASDISKENFDRQSLRSFDSGIGTSYSGQRYEQEF